jgi:hypothetical protein
LEVFPHQHDLQLDLDHRSYGRAHAWGINTTKQKPPVDRGFLLSARRVFASTSFSAH